MPLSSDTKTVFGRCLAVHFGFTEEVKEDEKWREEGEEGEEEEKEEGRIVTEAIALDLIF